MQDDARMRLLCCKYQKAILKGNKAIEQFEDIGASEISLDEPLDDGGNYLNDSAQDLFDLIKGQDNIVSHGNDA